MRRRVKVRLARRDRKRLVSTTVLVYQVTLGGFIEILRVAGQKVKEFQLQVRKGGDITPTDVRLALAHPDVCAGVADALCPDQPRDWFRRWYSQPNVARMFEAARGTSDWSRLIAQLDFSGKKHTGKGSLESDAIMVARLLNVNPREVLYEWPMEHFLDMCEALIRQKEAAQEAEFLDDPTMDPEAKPTPIIPGCGKVWVN